MADTRKNRKQARQEDLEELTVESEASTIASTGENVYMVDVIKALLAEQHKAESEREERREKARRAEDEKLGKAKRLEEEKKLEAKRAEDERLETLKVKRETEAREHAARLQREADDRTARLQQEAEDRAARLQKEVEDRQFQQQLQLIKLQKEMGETAGKVHRELVAKDRKQERALSSVACCTEEEDLEDYFMMVERRLEAAKVAKEEWVDIFDSKLRGRLAISWQDAVANTGGYQEARDKMLKSNGYTQRIAADKFFGWRVDQSGGLTVDQLYQRGQQLSRRMLAPGKLSEELEFSLVKGWLGTVIPRQARAAMDARGSENSAELIAVLQDYLALGGEGKSATFKKYGNGYGNGSHSSGVKEVNSSRPWQPSCFRCGKPGHKAADCWRGGSDGPKVGGAPVAGNAPKIICHTCGVEGHKSPQCPRRGKGSGNGAEAAPKSVKSIGRIRIEQSDRNKVEGRVNGHETLVLLDSGADISVVPANLVDDCQLVSERVSVVPARAFGDSPAVLLPMADVEFVLGDSKWKERVAVTPVSEGTIGEVLLSLDPASQRGLEIVLWANGIAQVTVARVITMSQAKDEKGEEKKEVEVVVDCTPIVKPVVPNGHVVVYEPGTKEGQVVLQESLVDDVLEDEDILDGMVVLFSEEEILSDLKDEMKIDVVVLEDVVSEEDEIWDGLVDLFAEEETLVDLKDEMKIDVVVLDDVVSEEDEIWDGLVDLFAEEETLVDLEVEMEIDDVVLKEDEVFEGLVNLFEEEEIVFVVEDGKESLCCLDENYDGFVKDSSDDDRMVKGEVEVEVDSEVEDARIAEVKVGVEEVSEDGDQILEEVGHDPSSVVEVVNLRKRYKSKEEWFDFEVWMKELKFELPRVVAAGLGQIGVCMPKIKGQLRACLGSVKFVWKFFGEVVWKFLGEVVWNPLVVFGWKFFGEVVWKFLGEFVWKSLVVFGWKFFGEVIWKLFGEFGWMFWVEFVWKSLVVFVWKFVVEFVWELVSMVVLKLVVESARRLRLEFDRRSSVLSPATSKAAPSVVVWDGARLKAFNTLIGMLCDVCVLTIPSSEDVFVFNLQEGVLKLLDFHFEIVYRPGSANGDADGLSRQAWCNLEVENSEEFEQLRTAGVSQFGGDVGAEPPQMEGVATSGVALQECGSVQESSRVATSGVALRRQEPCARTKSGVQE